MKVILEERMYVAQWVMRVIHWGEAPNLVPDLPQEKSTYSKVILNLTILESLRDIFYVLNRICQYLITNFIGSRESYLCVITCKGLAPKENVVA